jgi:hypothetical protein
MILFAGKWKLFLHTAFSRFTESACMGEPKGYKLFVSLGAAQTRRRLKGFGHGVRKVQTAGKNQAVVIHTATERHLRELEAKFADVGFSHSPFPLERPLDDIPGEPS